MSQAWRGLIVSGVGVRGLDYGDRISPSLDAPLELTQTGQLAPKVQVTFRALIKQRVRKAIELYRSLGILLFQPAARSVIGLKPSVESVHLGPALFVDVIGVHRSPDRTHCPPPGSYLSPVCTIARWR